MATTNESKNMALALGAAEEYRALMARGDVVLARQALRDIEAWVGYWDADRKFRLPANVRRAMGL